MITCASFFSGVGGFDLGFEKVGIRTVFCCEVDPHCRKLLARRFPDAIICPDIRAIAAVHRRLRRGKPVQNHEYWNRLFAALRSAALWCGGFPCQDLSVAGARAGLAGGRSGLWFTWRRIIALFRPAWVVGENVPGLLSSNSGRDFAVILHGLAKLGYGWAYRVLDAQYLAVPQRRERVFIVGSLGGQRASEILFEPSSVCWDSPPSRETREGIAGPIAAGSPGSGGWRAAYGGNNTQGHISISTACNAKGGSGRIDFESETFIAGTLNANGKAAWSATQQDAESNLLIPILRGGFFDDTIPFDTTQITNPDNRCNPHAGDPCHPVPAHGHPPAIAFSAKDHGADACEELSPTLRAGTHDKSHANGGVMPAVAFQTRYFTRKKTGGAPSDLVQLSATNAAKAGDAAPATIDAMGVRRLTPLECCRLMGWPDTHLDGYGFSDSTKYKVCGNGVVGTVSEWLGRRIVKALAR